MHILHHQLLEAFVSFAEHRNHTHSSHRLAGGDDGFATIEDHLTVSMVGQAAGQNLFNDAFGGFAAGIIVTNIHKIRSASGVAHDWALAFITITTAAKHHSKGAVDVEILQVFDATLHSLRSASVIDVRDWLLGADFHASRDYRAGGQAL